MMRFLNTWTGEFEFKDPKRVPYAILSHVWRDLKDGGEQSFADVKRMQDAMRPPGGRAPASNNPPTEFKEADTIFDHPDVSDKIKVFCRVAREADFQFAWNDACCIDKSSSAELSEAINSMYEWYRLSDVCYVHLADVPDDDKPEEDWSAFHRSRWHQRGFTLQELIAPECVVFLTDTWRFLGTKMGLASSLEAFTGVDFKILTNKAPLDSISVARRMSWASRRETTCVEDRAYSLMGLFGIHLSLIYGEGLGNAFLRLQEEIIRAVPDHSIFAWGMSCTISSLDRVSDWEDYARCVQDPRLLARTPAFFSTARDITVVPPSRFATTLRLTRSEIPSMHCVFAPEGVRMHLLCLPMAKAPHILEILRAAALDPCQDCRHLGEVDSLALLQCQNKNGRLIILPLRRYGEDSANTPFAIATHGPNSYSGSGWSLECGRLPYHTVQLADEVLAEVLEHIRPAVVEVTFIRHRYHLRPQVPKSLQEDKYFPELDLWPGHRADQIAFELSPHSIGSLCALGFAHTPLQVIPSERDIILETTLTLNDRDHSRTSTPCKKIELRLVLTESKALVATEARFFVKGVNLTVSRTDEPPPSTDIIPNILAINIFRQPGASEADLRDSLRAPIISPFGPRQRTIVHAEYIAQYTVDDGSRAATVLERLLRVALQFPFASLDSRRVLWLSIDLSEEYSHTPRVAMDAECFSMRRENSPPLSSQPRRQLWPGPAKLRGNVFYGDFMIKKPVRFVQSAGTDRLGPLPRTPIALGPLDQNQTISFETVTDDENTTATGCGCTGEERAITSSQEAVSRSSNLCHGTLAPPECLRSKLQQSIFPSKRNEGSTVNPAMTRIPVSGPPRGDGLSRRPLESNGGPHSTGTETSSHSSGMHLERVSHESLGDADAQSAMGDDVDRSGLEIEALRAQIEHLTKKNEALSSQNSLLSFFSCEGCRVDRESFLNPIAD